VVYVDHTPIYAGPDIMEQLRPCLEQAGQYIPPNADPAAKSVFDWVRLAIWIEVSDKRIALWLLGKRDPEDFYPLRDIDLLCTLGNQVGVALETARLVANLQQRAGELETAYRDLQRLDRLKDEFVQNVSHELRTPLTFLRGYADMLLDEMLGPITPPQREALLTVSDRTDGVIRLVNDIISMQHRQAEELVHEPVNLVALARSCLDAVEVATRRRESSVSALTFCLEAPEDAPPVLADRQRLAQVIDNLLSNAVKFSPNGGLIAIRVTTCCFEPDGFSPEIHLRPGLMLAVEDHGIGIEPEQLEQIWERFYQVDGSSRRRFGGLGLGLAIARSIVLAHEGKIWAESEVGRGSTFKVLLPILPIDAPATLQCLDNSSTLC
jgi:signal transduction histidine kinase